MGIRNDAGYWRRLQHFHPKLALAAEMLGVLLMMLVLCVEF